MPSNGLELSKILRWLQDKVPRLGWEAARRNRARLSGLYARPACDSSTPESPARRPKVRGVLPGGSVEDPGDFPGPKVLMRLQGFSELLGGLLPKTLLTVILSGQVRMM